MNRRETLVIGNPTILPYFTLMGSEDIDVPHLDNGLNKGSKEKGLVRGIAPNLSSYVTFIVLGYEHIVRPQKPFALKNAEEVVVVKSCWCPKI